MKPELIKISSKYQLIILLFFSVFINLNTVFHDYALDDIVVLTENRFVQKGISGIPEIITTDYVKGYTSKENLLTGVRYRPVSLILFALEYQFFGARPAVSHLINIILFALLVALLFKLLRSYFFDGKDTYLAFLACLLFAAHPIHTEVTANVKSRDEIITFILLIVSLISFIKYSQWKKTGHLAFSLIFFFLALLTKETAVTFIGVVPLIFYFFLNKSVKNSLLQLIPLAAVFAGYMILRYSIVGLNHYRVTDVTNSPYLYSTASEAFSTKVFILAKYIRLLVFPHPLSTDYGYNQIPYIDINSARFILSLLPVICLIAFAVFNFEKRSIFSFCILFFFVTISPGTNFIIDLGTPLAERMLFQPSLAFCIALSFLLIRISKPVKTISVILSALIVLLFSIKTIARNSEWKNNETLFLADINSSPESARLNLYVSEVYIIKANKENDEKLKNEYLQKAVYYGEKSLKIHSKFAYTYLRLGFAYYHLHDYFKTADLWIQAHKIEPADEETNKWTAFLSDMFYNQGNLLSEQARMHEAINCYQKSIALDSLNAEAQTKLDSISIIEKLKD